MICMSETFAKQERLIQKKLIHQLFIEGSTISAPSMRVRWLFQELNTSCPVQILFSVPKAIIPKATRRNLLKRRMREAYRKHKFILYDSLASTGKGMILTIIYSSHEILSTKEIQEKIIVILQRLKRENEKASE